MSEYAAMLKIGTTSLVLTLIEDGCPPIDTEIADPLDALRSVSRDQSYQWPVRMRDGTIVSALEIQRRYLDAAKKYRGRISEEVDMVLHEWERTLTDLATNPLSTSDRLDWSAKYKLYSEYISETGVSWSDEIMQSLDIEYHNINPQAGLYYGLEAAGELQRLTTDEEIQNAMLNAPVDTRAFARGLVIKQLLKSPGIRYEIDWDAVFLEKNRQIELKNPLHTYEKEAGRFLRGLG